MLASFPNFGQDTSSNLSRQVISPKINSSYLDARPLISHDGNTLYFCRRFHPQNYNGTRDGQDIWIAHRENGQWKKAYNPGEPLNNKRENAIASISPDGEEVILFNTYYGLFKKSESPISYSQKFGSNWSEPEDITINNFSNDNDFVDFYRAYNPDILIMAIEKPEEEGNQGNQDLYVSFPEGENTWSTPKNLGPTINTSDADFAPYLGPEGKRLFFVSMGHRGLGGSDIYYAERLDDSWQKWTEPENLGKPINTRNEETYFSITEDYSTIYFESYKRGAEDRDIFKAPMPEKFKPAFEPSEKAQEDSLMASNTSAGVEEENKQAENKQSQSLEPEKNEQKNTEDKVSQTGDDFQEDTAQTGKANQVTSPMNKAGQSPPADQQNEEMVAGAVTENEMESHPEKKFSGNISSGASLTSDINNTLRHIKIRNKGTNKRVEILQNIYFDYNSNKIRPTYHNRLKKIAGLLKQNPQMKVEISGFADDVGSHENNMLISEKRAKSVGAFIQQQQNLNENRFIYKAMGEKFPLASNDDEREGRELNRRVELVLILPTN